MGKNKNKNGKLATQDKSINKNDQNKNKQIKKINKKPHLNIDVNKTNKETKVDQRFSKASYDPKFLRPKKEMTKVKIDNRFSKMLTDPRFQNNSKVDKYGRKIQVNKQKQNQELKQFYSIQKDQQQESNQHEMSSLQEEYPQNGALLQQSQNEQEQDEQEREIDQEQHQDIRQWMENYDQESSSLQDMPIQEIMNDEHQGPEVWSDSQENMIKNEQVKATKRLALCNYDWMNINSKDLMILFNSFKSSAGFIKSVRVYQSQIGKEKMQEQEVFGPQGIWNQNEDNQDEFQEKQQEIDNGKYRKSWKQLLNKNEKTSLDERKLRAYQKQRLKYFYAVIECDSKRTADQIYKQCDGNQFQHSNLQFDLRFIPDEIQFESSMLKQQCNQLPVRGQVKSFVNKAMGHSKVQLTWEDPELSLPANLKKKNWNKLTQQQFDKIDWGAYLDEGADIDEQDNKKQLFDFDKLQDNQNLPDWKKQCNKRLKNKDQKEELVISFDSGFNAHQKIKKQENLPSLKKQKKSKKELRARAQQQRQRRRQELALLNDEDPKQTNFQVNLKDARFTAVYQNPQYSIDPSHPKFDHRKTGNVFKEVVQRNKIKHLS